MNGPEHYRQAEAVMEELERQGNDLRARGRMPAAEAAHAIAEMATSLQAAQVHATLALAALQDKLPVDQVRRVVHTDHGPMWLHECGGVGYGDKPTCGLRVLHSGAWVPLYMGRPDDV